MTTLKSLICRFLHFYVLHECIAYSGLAERGTDDWQCLVSSLTGHSILSLSCSSLLVFARLEVFDLFVTA